VGHRQKIFDPGEGMIRQGDGAQANYRKSETLPSVSILAERSILKSDIIPYFLKKASVIKTTSIFTNIKRNNSNKNRNLRKSA
jgi:hypothetical protein